MTFESPLPSVASVLNQDRPHVPSFYSHRLLLWMSLHLLQSHPGYLSLPFQAVSYARRMEERSAPRDTSPVLHVMLPQGVALMGWQLPLSGSFECSLSLLSLQPNFPIISFIPLPGEKCVLARCAHLFTLKSLLRHCSENSSQYGRGPHPSLCRRPLLYRSSKNAASGLCPRHHSLRKMRPVHRHLALPGFSHPTTKCQRYILVSAFSSHPQPWVWPACPCLSASLFKGPCDSL